MIERCRSWWHAPEAMARARNDKPEMLDQQFGPGGDRTSNNSNDSVSLFADQRQARRADHFGAVTAFGGGELDILHELDMGVEVEQRRVPLIDFARFVETATDCQIPEQS